MKKKKTLYDLIDYLQIKIISLKFLELQHKNITTGWELNTEENTRFMKEYIFLISMIKEMTEAEKFKSFIIKPSKLSEIAEKMHSEELRKQEVL